MKYVFKVRKHGPRRCFGPQVQNPSFPESLSQSFTSKGYLLSSSVRFGLDGQDSFQGIGPAGGGLLRRRHGRGAELLAGVHELGAAVLQTQIRGHGSEDEINASSPSTKTRARKAWEQRSAWYGGRMHSCEVRQVCELSRTRYRVRGGAQHLHQLVAELNRGSNVAEKLRLTKSTAATSSFVGEIRTVTRERLGQLHIA